MGIQHIRLRSTFNPKGPAYINPGPLKIFHMSLILSPVAGASNSLQNVLQLSRFYPYKQWLGQLCTRQVPFKRADASLLRHAAATLKFNSPENGSPAASITKEEMLT